MYGVTLAYFTMFPPQTSSVYFKLFVPLFASDIMQTSGSCSCLYKRLLKEIQWRVLVAGHSAFLHLLHTEQWFHRRVKCTQKRSALEGAITYRNYCQTLQP